MSEDKLLFVSLQQLKCNYNNEFRYKNNDTHICFRFQCDGFTSYHCSITRQSLCGFEEVPKQGLGFRVEGYVEGDCSCYLVLRVRGGSVIAKGSGFAAHRDC